MIQLAMPKKKRSRMDMAPLIDVVFLLLIFFMLTFVIQGQGMDISLPDGQPDETKNEENITLKIGQDSSIRVNNQITEIKELLFILESKLKEKNEKLVIVEADNKTKYDLFARVLDIARQAGAEDFSILMEGY